MAFDRVAPNVSNGTPVRNSLKQCAFCQHTGKLSNEHIVSQWMHYLFPNRFTAQYVGDKSKTHKFHAEKLDWKAGVVCKNCNETWMNDIETQHAQIALPALISGKVGVRIGRKEADSIAYFAFKTAVVLDHANRRPSPFFSRRLRYAFREHLLIPDFVNMWLCGYARHGGSVHVKTVYHDGETPAGYRLHSYVCTCALGSFVFQVVAVKQFGSCRLRPVAGFKHDLAIPFWPRIPKNFVWPPRTALQNISDFDRFAEMWQDVEVLQ
jgi:hypothetical protein